MLQLLAKLLCLTVMMGFWLEVAAESPNTHQNILPSGARFEMVQLPVAARYTFRLDRFTGRVWQYLQIKGSNNRAWDEILVLERQEISPPIHARFQIFMSKKAVWSTFLLDGDTGKSWIRVTDGNGMSLWEPL